MLLTPFVGDSLRQQLRPHPEVRFPNRLLENSRLAVRLAGRPRLPERAFAALAADAQALRAGVEGRLGPAVLPAVHVRGAVVLDDVEFDQHNRTFVERG